MIYPTKEGNFMAYTLPELGYAYDALEPFYDAKTLEIHHSKHHQTYVNNANLAVEAAVKTVPALAEYIDVCPGKLLKNLDKVAPENRQAVINNVGGHANHSFFWKNLKKGTTLQGALKEAIVRDFGSVDAFQEAFEKAAAGCFGSGWTWLVVQEGGKLAIVSTSNQYTPIMGKAFAGCEGFPLIVIDVWEHAYYLKHQNRRPEYIKEFWNIVNWDFASERFEKKVAEAGCGCAK